MDAHCHQLPLLLHALRACACICVGLLSFCLLTLSLSRSHSRSLSLPPRSESSSSTSSLGKEAYKICWFVRPRRRRRTICWCTASRPTAADGRGAADLRGDLDLEDDDQPGLPAPCAAYPALGFLCAWRLSAACWTYVACSVSAMGGVAEERGEAHVVGVPAVRRTLRRSHHDQGPRLTPCKISPTPLLS